MALSAQQKAAAIRASAEAIGADPLDLARAISYETQGTFSPSLWGGAGGNYLGLIQFGPSERQQFGVSPDQTFMDQLGSTTSYLQTRGFRPGMGLPEMYSIINAGSLGPDGQPRWGARDINGTLRQHVARMESGAYDTGPVQALLSPTIPPVPQPAPSYAGNYDPARTASLIQGMGYTPPAGMAPQSSTLWNTSPSDIPFSSGATAAQVAASGYMPKATEAQPTSDMAGRFADAFSPASTIADLPEDLTIGGNPPKMGQATVIQPSSIPKGPYGTDAVVRAAASGDPAALKTAIDAAKGQMWTAILGGTPYGTVKNQLDGYLGQVSQVAPGAMRDVQTAIQQNPQIATMAAPIMPQLSAAFKSMPQPQTVTMPLPVARPDVMVAQTPPSPRQTPIPDWSQIAAYRPSTGTTGASEPQSWGQMASNTAGNVFNAFGNFLGASPAQASTPPTGNSPISPELGITSYRPTSQVSAAAAPAQPAQANAPMTTAEFDARFDPTATTAPGPDPMSDYQRLTGQALPTPQSLMMSMMAGTLPMATPAQPVAIVPTATALKKPAYSPYNAPTGAYSPGVSSGVNGSLRNGSGSYSGGTRGSNGAVYSPSSVTVGGQTYHPVSGSTVISPSGTIMSPSEAVSAMSSGNWKRGGRIKTYDPVL